MQLGDRRKRPPDRAVDGPLFYVTAETVGALETRHDHVRPAPYPRLLTRSAEGLGIARYFGGNENRLDEG